MAIRPRKLKSGKVVYDITTYGQPDASGKRPRHYTHADTLKQAKLIEAELIASCAAIGGQTTLTRYINEVYWPVTVKRLAPSSCDTYRYTIDKQIIPALGKIPIRDITRAEIQSLLVDNCATSGIASKAVGILKTILNEALHDGYITTNYACSKFALPSTSGKSRDNGLVLSTFAEIHVFLDMVDTHAPVMLQRLAYSGLLQGLRPEERYALDWSCFDMQTRTITINQAFTAASRLHGGGQLKETKTKHSARVLPMHPRFYDFVLSTPSNHVGAFITSNNHRMTPSTAQKQWLRFLDAHVDCPRVTIENMRHSFATAYLANGGHIETLSRILGHSNISTTINRYYKPDIGVLRADMLRVAEN